jgi:hypothetical protein
VLPFPRKHVDQCRHPRVHLTYPVIESVHVLGLTLFMGLLLLWDLRLLGITLRGFAVSRVWSRLFPGLQPVPR